MRKPRLTYAGVVSTLALFIALGGASYAAVHLARNSVGAKQLKAKAVTAAKLAPGAVGATALAEGSITGSKLAEGSVAGSKVVASSLGTVPNATHAASADAATTAASARRAEHATTAELGETLTPLEGDHLVGVPPDPTFNAGWGDVHTLSSLVFYKDHEGVVHLEGWAARSSGTEKVIFSLPAGFAPASPTILGVLVGGNLGNIIVNETGAVELNVGNPTSVDFDGVSWRAAQ